MAETVLALHRGSRSVTVEELAAVVPPPPTATWFPTSHIKVLECARDTLTHAGFEVRREQYGLSQDNSKFFGTFDLTSGLADGVTLSAGIRNSIDKSITIGFAAGSRVFVCDNLSISGELVVSRKHTRFGADRYQEAISLAVQKLGQFQTAERLRIEHLKETEIDRNVADSIILRSYSRGLISHLQLPTVIREWDQPSFSEFQGRTLWSLWNAFTFAVAPIHKSSSQRFAKTTIALQDLFSVPASQQVIDATPQLALSV